MLSFGQFIREFSPLIIFPYVLAALFIISYYIFLKYRLMRNIKEISIATRKEFKTEIILKNLHVKSMVYNFILILSICELVANILLQVSQIKKYDFEIVVPRSEIISNSCVIRDTDMIDLIDKQTFFVNRTLSIAITISTMFPITMALFFVVLRRMFLNAPYHQCIRKYCVYILIQFLVKTLLSCFMQTRYFAQLLFFPMAVIDVCIYISKSRQFYLLLKGCRDSARFHSSQSVYLEKKGNVKHFLFSQICILFIFSLLLSAGFLSFIAVPLDISAYNPCFLSYISFGFIPDISIPKQIQLLNSTLGNYFLIFELIFGFFAEVVLTAIYIGLSVGILIRSIKRRNNYAKVNEDIRPLIDKYKKTVCQRL